MTSHEERLLKMAENTLNEQRIVIKFYVKLGKSFTEIYEDLQKVYIDSCVSKSTISKWMNRFIDGRETAEDDHRKGRPVTVKSEDKISAIEKYIKEDRRVTVTNVAEKFDISFGSAQDIMTNKLGMRRVCARWVPRLLLPEQMRERVKRCQEYSERYVREGDYFINRVITCDETWMHFFEPESKQQSSVWKHPSSPSPIKARLSKSAGKVMCAVFCDINGIILNHMVPPKTTITGNYYATLLRSELLPAIKRKRPHLIQSGFILHQDNAPSHCSHVVEDTTEKLGIELLPHAPYSPDLAICDFWLFPNLKNNLRGQRFESREELWVAMNKTLREMSRDGLQHVFRAWMDRWEKCKRSKGRYFEKE